MKAVNMHVLLILKKLRVGLNLVVFKYLLVS